VAQLYKARKLTFYNIDRNRGLALPGERAGVAIGLASVGASPDEFRVADLILYLYFLKVRSKWATACYV